METAYDRDEAFAAWVDNLSRKLFRETGRGIEEVPPSLREAWERFNPR